MIPSGEMPLRAWQMPTLRGDRPPRLGLSLDVDLDKALSVESKKLLEAQPPQRAMESLAMVICESLFTILNVGPDDHPWVIEWRQKNGCYSMSVGDIVILGESAWICGAFGWDPATPEDLEPIRAVQG